MKQNKHLQTTYIYIYVYWIIVALCWDNWIIMLFWVPSGATCDQTAYFIHVMSRFAGMPLVTLVRP
jgi:hypothetical protein